MSPQNRRSFILSTGTVAASILGQTEGALAKQDHAADPVAQLNLQFRTLYGVNREELLLATPLAALTLIGTGEIWRIEFGKAVKSYPPIPWIVHAKGLMHGVIGTQATWARLMRGQAPDTAREATVTLTSGLTEAASQAAKQLPAKVATAASVVLETLRKLAAGWAAGKPTNAAEFPDSLTAIKPKLDQVLTAAGEAVYESIVRGLKSCANDSDPQAWGTCLVGVCGVGFARRDNIEIAAAMSVLGRDALGTRLLYLENAFTIQAGITQIGAALADRELGQAVFGDPYRMWRDLLGDVAVQHAGGGFFPEMGRPS